MDDVRLIDANIVMSKLKAEVDNIPKRTNYPIGIADGISYAMATIDCAPRVDAQPVKHGHWSECYRDSRCISVICSVCKNPTVIAHGCRDTDEVTMDDVIEKLPHCPKCCSDMRGDADD